MSLRLSERSAVARVDAKAAAAAAVRAPPLTWARQEVALALLTAVWAAGAVTAIVHGGVSADPAAFALVIAWSIVGFAAAGAMWRRARPWSVYGTLLILEGFLLGLESAYGRPEPLVFSSGFLVDSVQVLLIWWLVIAFPSGRLDRAGRLLFLGAVAVVVLGLLPMLLVTPHVQPPTPAARCAGTCPANWLAVVDDPSLGSVLGGTYTAIRAAFAVALLAALALRFRRATLPRRRVLGPVYLVAGLWMVGFLAWGIAARVDGVPSDVANGIGIALTAARAALPIGFMGAIVLARAHAGAALQAMVRALPGESSADAIQRIVREALQDPSARITFWLPRARRYADLHGRKVEPPRVDGDMTWRTFTREGEPVVGILHDGVLDEDPELVDAAGAAAVLALENSRLQHDLRRTVSDLRASRRRLVNVGAAERRRLERDLHDSAQQHLHAIRIQLELTKERTEPDSDIWRRLSKLGEEVDEAIDELRAIAHGIFPPLLAEAGLSEALAQAARPLGAAVDVRAVGRFTEEIETAVYFCCVEALQNAAKHAGPDAMIRVRLRREGSLLRFSVSDDGVGFVTARNYAGVGLTNMADRVGAIGGTLSVVSAPQQGTTIEGSVRVS